MYGKLIMKVNRFKQSLIDKGNRISWSRISWSRITWNRINSVILAAFIVIVYCGCFPPPYNENYSGDFDLKDSDVRLAVMNFDYNGYGLSSKLALNVADNITADLFIKKRVNVVDRNLVREILIKDENVKRDKYSREDVKRIGSSLNATHIVFGSLYSAGSTEDYYKTEKFHVDLTLRIVAVGNGEVVGVIKQSTTNSNLELLLDKLVKKIVKSM
jgi:hypothetical protein